MDQVWRVLRIIGQGIFALAALVVVSCTVIVQLDTWPKDRARNPLWTRSMEILKQKKKNSVVATVNDVFGADLDGVCVVASGRPNIDAMRKASPGKFDSVIPAIVEMRDVSTLFGRPWEGDAWYSFVYAVRGGAVVGKYELVRKSSLDIYVTEGDDNRCFDRGVAAQLNFYPPDGDSDASLSITIPPDRNLKS